MFNKKRIFVFVVFILFMFIFITFAGGTPQNQAVATRLVTFIDGYDNSEISQQKVIVGEDAEVPDAPKHDAMAFAGWYLEEDRTIEVTDFTNIITDLTVVAEYGDDINRNGILDEDEEYYTVRFVDGLTNTVIKTQTVLNGMNATAPQAPKHDGYTFVGWSRGYTNVEEDITVNAVYQANTNVEVNSYNVTFIDGDTKEIITIVEVQEGLSATLPEAPKHDKRVFDHWEGNYTQIAKDETVIAIYADDINDNNKPDYLEDKYSVIYEKGLEEVTGEVPKDENEYLENTNYTVLDNETMKLEKAVFIGWSETNPEKKIETLEELENLVLVRPEAELKIGSSDVTYYAVWANDENGNNKPDYRDEHYTVEFTVDKEYTNLVTGTMKFENILEGLNFYDEVTVPEIIENNEDKIAFDKWEPVLPEENAKVTANMTFKAVFAKDENNNEIPDSRDKHYTVEFTVDKEYTNLVTGTMKFENILEGLNFYDEVTVPEIIENNEDKIAFDKWEPVLPEENAKVTANMTFKAVFAKDENNNEIPDSRDEHYTVEFTVDKEYANLVTGTMKFENILEGLNFYDEVTVPEIIENNEDNIAFDKWEPVLPEENAKVTANMTFKAVFAKDENNNEIPDSRDKHYTVEFTVDKEYANLVTGTMKFENILEGLNFYDEVTVPEIIENNEDNIAFDKWEPVLPEENAKVTANMTFKAVFATDENNNEIPDSRDKHYTVEFTVDKEYTNLVTGTMKFENILEGLNFYDEVTVPEIIENNEDKIAFDKWEPVLPEENAKVTANMTFKAVFAKDENNNEIPDSRDEHYTVEFTVDKEYANLVTGTMKFENILEGLNFYDEVTVPEIIENNEDKIAFDKWEPVLPEEDAKVTANMTFKAVFAKDENNNEIPDSRDEHYTVEFTVDKEYANLVTGTMKFENILEGLNFYDEVTVPEIIENNEDNIAFDKWEPVLPEEDAKVTANMTFKAVFAKDENNNEIPDSRDEHYTVEFTVDNEYKNLVTGTMKFENILEGLNFYDEVKIPEIIENNEDKIAFDKWEPVLPEEDAKVTANMTFKAVFAKDENNNEIPDHRDTYLTVTFLDDDGSTISSSKVLFGLSVTVPNNPEKESTAQYNYSFIGWYKGEVQITDFTNIQEDLTVTAKYSETVRKYKVIFKDYYGTSIKEVTVDYGTSVEAPNVATEIKLSGQNSIVEFTGWSTDEYLFVQRELVVKAEYNMLKSSTTTLYKLPSYLIRQEDGGADDREFSSLAEITIKDDAEGNLGKIMSNTKEGEYKLAVGKDDVLKYLTEESRTIVENNNADIYVLKYNPKDGWHLDCQINNEDIAVYRNGNNGLKVISNSHNITKVERYEKKYVFLQGTKWVKQEEHNAINQSAGIYIISDFSVNIEGNNSMYRIYYDNNKYVDYYWNEQ